MLFGIEGHATLDINPELGYNALLLRLIPADLLSACPHRQFHTLTGLLYIRAALSNSTLMSGGGWGGGFYHFDVLWYNPAGMGTHDLPHATNTLIIKPLGYRPPLIF